MPEPINTAWVNSQIAKWWQGDFLLVQNLEEELKFEMIHLVTGSEMSPECARALDIKELEVEGFAVISQSCDINREFKVNRDRCWVTVSPITRPANGQMPGIVSGHNTRYTTFSSLERIGLVIDLERMMTISKPLLAKCTSARQVGCEVLEERRKLSRTIGNKLGRPALPNDFTDSTNGNTGAVVPLIEFINTAISEDNEMGCFLRSISEIRLMPFGENEDNPWESKSVRILFLFVCDYAAESISLVDRESWEECAKEVVSKMATGTRFSLNAEGYRVNTIYELTGFQYSSSDLLQI